MAEFIDKLTIIRPLDFEGIRWETGNTPRDDVGPGGGGPEIHDPIYPAGTELDIIWPDDANPNDFHQNKTNKILSIRPRNRNGQRTTVRIVQSGLNEQDNDFGKLYNVGYYILPVERNIQQARGGKRSTRKRSTRRF
jgi:hypothetical protein